MKKYYTISLSLALFAGCTWFATPQTDDDSFTCGGIAGLTCPENYVCYYPESADYPDATGQCIPEYVDRGDVGTNETVDDTADSEVCPTDGPFEVGVDSEDKYCVCPDGYEKNSDVIGYEICYGDAECPILEVECVQAVDTTIEVGPTEDDVEALVDAGELYNEEYGYIIEVGVEHVDNMTEVAITPFDGVTATYVYCYDTIESDYASYDCPGTAAETFRINVYTSEQYETIADGPGAGTVITEVVGYVYELSHPNGLLPADVPADDDFYETVVTSFHFAG